MDYVLHFDYATLAVFAVTFFVFFVRKNTKGFRNTVFAMLMIDSAAATIFDIFSVVVHFSSESLFFKYFFHAAYYLTHTATPFIFFTYIILLTDSPKAIKRWKKLCMFIPYGIEAIAILTTPFTHWIFYMENGNYYHGKLQFICYIATGFYLITGIIYTRLNKKNIKKSVRLSVYAFTVISIIPIGLQIYKPAYLLECFGGSICILLILLTIQNNDEMIDFTTGLMNSSAFDSNLSMTVNGGGNALAVIIRIADSDKIAKTLGKHFTVLMTQAIAKYFSTIVKFGDGYYLGDETIVLLYPDGSYSMEFIIADIKKRFEKSWKVADIKTRIPIYIGAVTIPDDVKTAEEMYDSIYYIQNLEGQDKKLLFAGDIQLGDKSREVAVLKAIENAIDNNGFEVYYQPIYSADKDCIESCEALVRLNDKNLGFIPPDEFITLAERNGSILTIGRTVLESVCRYLVSGKPQKLGINIIEVNISAVECMQSDFAASVIEILDEYNVRPEQLCFEITETAASYSPEVMKNNIDILCKKGITFAMDDYGTGYSNINSLINLPFEYIKLDKTFVWSSMKSDEGRIAIESTIAMMKKLNRKIIAEGIENDSQFQALTDMGSEYIQGFLISKPVPTDELERAVKRANLV